MSIVHAVCGVRCAAAAGGRVRPVCDMRQLFNNLSRERSAPVARVYINPVQSCANLAGQAARLK